jgi:hypothetical protein
MQPEQSSGRCLLARPLPPHVPPRAHSAWFRGGAGCRCQADGGGAREPTGLGAPGAHRRPGTPPSFPETPALHRGCNPLPLAQVDAERGAMRRESSLVPLSLTLTVQPGAAILDTHPEPLWRLSSPTVAPSALVRGHRDAFQSGSRVRELVGDARDLFAGTPLAPTPHPLIPSSPRRFRTSRTWWRKPPPSSPTLTSVRAS